MASDDASSKVILGCFAGKIYCFGTQPQVCRSAKSRIYHPGDFVTNKDKREWRSEVDAFIGELNAQKPEGAKPVRIAKVQRMAVYDLECMMDWMLQCGINIGVSKFDGNLNLELPLHRRPRMTWCLDSDGVNCSWMADLLYGRLSRGHINFDPIHRANRATFNGIKDANMYAMCTLGVILANGDRGPFGSQENIATFRANAREYLAKCDDDFTHFGKISIKLIRNGSDTVLKLITNRPQTYSKPIPNQSQINLRPNNRLHIPSQHRTDSKPIPNRSHTYLKMIPSHPQTDPKPIPNKSKPIPKGSNDPKPISQTNPKPTPNRSHKDSKPIPNLSQNDPKPIPNRSQKDPKPIPHRYQTDPKTIPNRSQTDHKPIPKRSETDSKPFPNRYHTDPKPIPNRSQHDPQLTSTDPKLIIDI